MADYISTLNGQQMDAALMDMAEHNSEAWAVGERNGVPVGSDDVTYQNNAQYYAQQAQSIAPASVTEAVRWDIAQTALTDANKEQARSNIDAGKNGAWSNRNLLDNWYFVGGGSQLGDGVFPINQRGLTSYGVNSYNIDRWICYASGGSVTLNANGVTAPAYGVMTQPTANLTQLNGKTLTLSILYETGLEVGTAVLDLSGSTIFISNQGVAYITSSGLVQFYKEAQYTVKAVKLELGTVSTLMNDAPPDFGEELRKCQRYLRYVSLKRLPVFCDANYLVAMTTLEGIEMRATPTPTLVSAGYIFNPATSATSVPTAVSILAFEYNTATIQLSIPASFNGFCMAVDGAICLSAEL